MPDAAERLEIRSDIPWILVGDGRLADQVRQDSDAQSSGQPRASAARFSPRSDAGILSRGICIVCFVSLCSDAIFSLTVPANVQAYLVSGRPIIAMLDVEGASIVAESGARLTRRAGNAEGLAARVRELYELAAAARAAMGSRGREYSRQHSDREVLL